MKWNYKDYIKWKNNGFPTNLEVTKLDISDRNIKSLEGINNLTNLKVLHCHYNKIKSLEGINNLVNLQVLQCDNNQIESLEEINNLINLRELYCFANRLKLLEGINNLINLQKFYCFANRLKSLEGINNLINLQELCCSNNEIESLEGINNFINLRKLYCSGNKIKSLNELNNLINLQELYCVNNKIELLDRINNLINLQILHCGHNQIVSLEGINNLINLRELCCNNNQITSLNELNNLLNLKLLYCGHNQIESLNGINNLINLEVLDCTNNLITSLNELNNLRNLRGLYYSNNPIEYIPPNITRSLNRIKHKQNIYDDRQNVHNHNIQECIRQSIQNVLNVKPLDTNIYESIINDDILTQNTKQILINYSNNKEVHSTLNVTFEELLIHVFSLIELNPHSEEIKSILNIEMNDSLCKCFTGRMSRLINCLNGFDPLVKIEIAENEQIGQIIGLTKEKLEMLNKYTVESHREMVKSEMLDRGYTIDKINEWVQYIE